MYKQRAKRVGTGKTAEQKRQRYERLMERTQYSKTQGVGKAFAGSKKNKHLPKHLRSANKSDWFTLQVSPIDENNRGIHRQLITMIHLEERVADKLKDHPNAKLINNCGKIVMDHAQGSKPEHHKRAVNIVDSFTLPHHEGEKQAQTMIEKLKAKLVKGKE